LDEALGNEDLYTTDTQASEIDSTMWTYLLGPFVSLLPRRWRALSSDSTSVQWVQTTVVSGLLECLGGVIGLVYWYSYSVSHWVQKSLQAANSANSEAVGSPPAEGLVGFLLIAMHPVTWLIVGIMLEGIVRMCASLFAEESLGTLPLFLIDKLIVLFYRRGNDKREFQRSIVAAGSSFFGALRQRYQSETLSLVPDELHYLVRDSEHFLEIHACRPKAEWDPPRVIQYSDTYFSLESSAYISGGPRPFVYTLRKLSVGVPARTVLIYDPDLSPLTRE
jgi:hypothetical protein